MNTNSTNKTLLHSGFSNSRPTSEVFHIHKLILWGLAIIEALLFLRFILEYFDIDRTSTLTQGLYTITQYILFPFAMTFNRVSANNDGSVWIIMIAITGYFLLAITFMQLLKAGNFAPSRIERARALSRKKYIH